MHITLSKKTKQEAWYGTEKNQKPGSVVNQSNGVKSRWEVKKSEMSAHMWACSCHQLHTDCARNVVCHIISNPSTTCKVKYHLSYQEKL